MTRTFFACILLFNCQALFSQMQSGKFTIEGRVSGPIKFDLWLANFTLNRVYDTTVNFIPANEISAMKESQTFEFKGQISGPAPMRLGWLPEGKEQIQFSDIFFLDTGRMVITMEWKNDTLGTLSIYPHNPLNDEINTLNRELFFGSLSKEQRNALLSKWYNEGKDSHILLWLLAKQYYLSGYSNQLAECLETLSPQQKSNTLFHHLQISFTYENANLVSAADQLKPLILFPFDKLSFGGELKSTITSKPFTLIEFWATWCAPCMKQMPELVKVHLNHGSSLLNVLGVAWEQRRKNEEFTKQIN